MLKKLLKRLAIGAIWAVATVYFLAACDHFPGARASFLILLCLFAAAWAGQTWRETRVRREVGQISDDDTRPIRFDGSPDQVSRVAQIGEAHGWQAEVFDSEDPRLCSIRLHPGENSSAPTRLLEAMFAAGLARKVQP